MICKSLLVTFWFRENGSKRNRLPHCNCLTAGHTRNDEFNSIVSSSEMPIGI